MALTLNNFTGFETQGTEEASASAGTLTYETTNQRNGGAALIINALNEQFDFPWVEGNVTDAGSAYIFSVAIRFPSTPSASPVILAVHDDAGSVIADLRIATASDAIQFRDANGGALDTSGTLNANTWYFFEVYAQLNNASGNWEWFQDDTSLGSGSGADFTDGNAFGSSSSFIRLTNNSSSSTILFDDIYILSGATAASDRYGDFAVKAYQNTAAGATDNGNTLDNGTWALVSETPQNSGTANDAEYNTFPGGAIQGDTTTDAGTRSGPSGDADVSGATIKGGKWIWVLERGNGKAHSNFRTRYGNDVDGTSTDLSISLTTAYNTFFQIQEPGIRVPESGEYFRIGFGTSGDGAQAIRCAEQWAMLGFVPAGVTFVDMSGAPTGTGSVESRADTQQGLRGDSTGTGDAPARASVQWGLSSDIDGIGLVEARADTQQGLVSSISGTGLVEARADLQQGLSSNIDGVGLVEARMNQFQGFFGNVFGQGDAPARASVQWGLSSNIDGIGLVEARMNQFQGFSSNIDGIGLVEGSLEIVAGVTFVDMHGDTHGIVLLASRMNNFQGFVSAQVGTALVEARADLQQGMVTAVTANGVVESRMNQFQGFFGNVAGQGDAPARASVQWGLSSNISGTGLVEARMTLLQGLRGNIDGTGLVESRMNQFQGFFGNVFGAGDAPARASVQWGLSGNLDGTGLVEARMNQFQGLRGNIDGLGLVEGSLEIVGVVFVDMHGNVTGIALLDSRMNQFQGFFGNVDGQGDAPARASVQWGLSSNIDGAGLVEGRMNLQQGLFGNTDGESLVESRMNLQQGFVSAVIGSGSVDSRMNTLSGLRGSSDSIASVASFLGNLIGAHGEVVTSMTIDARAGTLNGLFGDVNAVAELAASLTTQAAIVVPIDIDLVISDRLIYAIRLIDFETFTVRTRDIASYTMEISDA